MQHKRGATFSKLCTYKQSDGTLINLTNIAITSQVRSKDGKLISTATIAKLDQITNTGKYTITMSTNSWPVERLICDVRYEGANVDLTDTFEIDVTESVTTP